MLLSERACLKGIARRWEGFFRIHVPKPRVPTRSLPSRHWVRLRIAFDTFNLVS